MKAFKSNISTFIIRLYLMMAVVFLAGFTGFWWLAALALPIFLSALLSVRFFDKKKKPRNGDGKIIRFGDEQQERRAI